MSGLSMYLNVRKSKNDEAVTTLIAYPSTYMPLDYANGQIVDVFGDDDEIIQSYTSVGYVAGTMITIVADPGLGKTTYAQQASVEIIRPFKDSFIIHEDMEQSSHINRVYNITRMNASWIENHYVIYQDGHTEKVVDRFIDHAKMKLANRDKFSYDTGLRDMFNKPLKTLVPTVELWDSLSVMRSEDTSFIDMNALNTKKTKKDTNESSVDDVTNNMAGARNAKFNSEVFKQILPWAKRANIIFFVISQINRKISTGFVSSARDLTGLGENETISGGRAALYLANNVLRFKNKKSLKVDVEYGINGHIVSAEFYKSRTSATQVPVELIFDKQRGFSKVLTLVHLLIINGIAKKSGNGYYLPGLDKVPFTKKNVRDVARDSADFCNRLYELSLIECEKLLSYAGPVSSDEDDEELLLASYNNMLELIEQE